MNSFYGALLILTICFSFGLFFLYIKARERKSLILFASLFSLLLGIFLLVMDSILLALMTPGTEYIKDYLLFQRSAGDIGIAGRWIFTGYAFLLLGVFLVFYYVGSRIFKKIRGEPFHEH